MTRDEVKRVFRDEISGIRRFAGKLHRQCENNCNGYGYIPYKGKYYAGFIDEWVKKEHGRWIKSAYTGEDETVFDLEIERLETKIKDIVDSFPRSVWPIVSFQHDPRGWEITLTIAGMDVSTLVYV